MRTAPKLMSAVAAAAILFGFSGMASVANAAEQPSGQVSVTESTAGGADDEMTTQGTRQFTVTNLSGHTLTIADIWGTTGWPQMQRSGFDLQDSFPRTGSTLKPGAAMTFEVRDWSNHGINIKFKDESGRDAMVYLHVSGLSRYSDAQGLDGQFVTGGGDVAILDKPGTVITVGNNDPKAQSAALTSLCEQSAVTCTFTPTDDHEVRVMGPQHGFGKVAVNSTPLTQQYTVGGNDTIQRSESLEISASIKATIMSAVETSLSTTWGRTTTASHTFTHSVALNIPKGWVGWLEAREPMFQDTGDFTIKMQGSNTEWTVKNVTFEHPDENGVGEYWMLARPMTAQEQQEARDRGGKVSDPWVDDSVPTISVPLDSSVKTVDLTNRPAPTSFDVIDLDGDDVTG